MKQIAFLILFTLLISKSNAQTVSIRNNKSCGVTVRCYGVDPNHTACSRVYLYTNPLDLTPGATFTFTPADFPTTLGQWVGVEMIDCQSSQGTQPPCRIGYATYEFQNLRCGGPQECLQIACGNGGCSNGTVITPQVTQLPSPPNPPGSYNVVLN